MVSTLRGSYCRLFALLLVILLFFFPTFYFPISLLSLCLIFLYLAFLYLNSLYTLFSVFTFPCILFLYVFIYLYFALSFLLYFLLFHTSYFPIFPTSSPTFPCPFTRIFFRSTSFPLFIFGFSHTLSFLHISPHSALSPL